MIKLAVVGSRSFNDYDCLAEALAAYLPFTLVSGGAKGADALAERFADEHGLYKVIIKPDWQQYGRAAGPIRNRKIVEAADKLVAFWDGKSKGTKSSIDYARKKGLEVKIVEYNAG